jgi:hypothetical protein
MAGARAPNAGIKNQESPVWTASIIATKRLV